MLLLPLLPLLLGRWAGAAEQIPYNWLSLAVLSASDYPSSSRHFDRSHSQTLCARLVGLNSVQKDICAQSPMSIPFIARGVREAIFQCQEQFKNERWNCSDRHEVTTTPYGLFKDILGKTLRSATREGAFLTAIATAGVVHEVVKGCNTGNLSECGCDNHPDRQTYVDTDIQDPVQPQHNVGPRSVERFSWGGCSDNVNFGIMFAVRFFDEFEKREFERTKEVRHLVNKHNHFVGREQIKNNIRRQCRCHGVSGSCEFKTCWLVMPKFSEVADMLKKRYNNFAVQVENNVATDHVARRVKKRLRRKERGERQNPIRGNELTYLLRSPSYCERNDTMGIIGTVGRECRHSSYDSDSCDLLCCGRGYNTRMENRKTQCHCKFVWCCQVKCKECIDDVLVHTCK